VAPRLTRAAQPGETMKLAVVSDIHGNFPALLAVARHIRATGHDAVVVLGDIVVGCPDSWECWELVHSLGWRILRGNHERYVGTFDSPDAPPEWFAPQWAPVRWAVERAPSHAREQLLRLPTTLAVPGMDGATFLHASRRNDTDSVHPHTPDPALSEMFSPSAPRLVVRGHNHVAQTRLWSGGTILTNGSVGLPMDGHTTAQYTTLTRRSGGGIVWQHHSITYDLARALARFTDTGYLRAAGPMARLFHRELATATLQVVPFLAWWTRWKQEGTQPDLAEAVQRFLLL